MALTQEQHDELETRFTYVAPTEGQIPKFQKIRHDALELARVISDSTPPCREQSLAITKLEEAVMWANAAIARRGLGE